MALPNKGTLRRAPIDCDVIVGTFEEVPSQAPGSKDKIVLPDLSQCQMPLRMKITPADPAVKTSEEVLTLQDASGKHAFRGLHGSLENNYVVVVEETDPHSGNAVYQVLPVTHWVNFQRSANLPQLSIEDQQELYEMLQKHGDRPSRAKLAMERYNEKMKGSGKFTEEGGVAAYAGDLDDTEVGFGGNYRTAMAASSRTRKGGGGAGDDGPAFDGEDFEAAYNNMIGNSGAAGGAADDEFGDGGDADGRVRARDGADYADDAVAGYGKEYDVIGDEAGGEEAAADLMMDYFADDAGDDGALADDDGVRMDKDWDAEDAEAGGAAAARGAEEELGVDLDSDALDGDDLAKAAAAAAAAAAAPEDEGKDKDKDRKRHGQDLDKRAAKRARFDVDNVESMREELLSFIRSQGGKCTAAALSKAFGSYVKEPAVKARFFALVGEVTKQTKELDGKLYFAIKK